MEATAAERYASGGPGRDLYAQNLAMAFQATVDRIGDDPAIRTGDGDDEVVITWNELREQVGRIAGGLASLGVSKGDTVAIMLNNRPEFIPIDLAAVSLGAVPFSIYQTSSPEQIEYVVSDAGAKVAIVEPAFLEVFSKAREDLPEVETLIVVDGEGGDHTLAELEAIDPELRHLRLGCGGRARRPADPDLHLGHDRAAEGRPAHPSQPDDADGRGRGHRRLPGSRRAR